MDEYTIIGWPDIQAFMELDGFGDNATLINENDSMGIDSSTYLVRVDWLNLLQSSRSVEEEKKHFKNALSNMGFVD